MSGAALRDAGVAPAHAASPSTAAVQEAVADAVERRTPLRLVGRGSWLDAGRPVRAGARLSLGESSGILEYTPGDLTLTARAGTSLAEIDAVTLAERQWLALDPFGGDRGSLGATVATASAGPLAHGFGAVRDNVLGVEFVTGAGAVVRGGGRVVKNVAGFDLTRLVTGSWGTLGAITEVTVRLRQRPEVDETVALEWPTASTEFVERWRRLRAAPIAPWALELIAGPLAAGLALGDRPVLVARLGGNEELVRAQRTALATLGDLVDASSQVWRALREYEPAGATVTRLSWPPAALPEACARLFALARSRSDWLLHASVRRGVVRCIGRPDADPTSLVAASDLGDPTRIDERLSARLWAERDARAAAARGGVARRLERDVRRAFDPHGILNPGILGGNPEDAS